MSNEQQQHPKYVVHQAVQSAVGDYANVNNYLPVQTAAIDAGVAELRQLFEQVNQRLATLDEVDRAPLALLVEQTAAATAEIQQGQASDEKQSFLEKRLKNIYAMAPDIGEVIIATLASPTAGIALTIQKIAQKAKHSVGIGQEK